MTNNFSLIITKSSLNYYVHLLMLIMVLFAGSALYSEDNVKYYIDIILGINFITILYCIYKPFLLRKSFLAFSFYPFTWWMILLFGFYLMHYALFPSYDDFNSDYVFFILVVMLNIIIWFRDISTENAIKIFISSCIWTSVLLILYIILNEWQMILLGATRIGDSAAGNVNTVGLYVGTFSLPCLYKIIIENKKKYIPIYLVQAGFMLLTGSKKTLISIILGFCIFYFFKNRLRLSHYIFPVLVALGGVYFVMENQYFYNIIGFRITDMLYTMGFDVSGGNYSHSTEIREDMMLMGLEAFFQSPIWGNGWFYFSQYSGLGTYSHNNYIELLVTYGLIGFFLYYSMFIFVLYKLYYKLRQSDLAKLFFAMVIIEMINNTASITFYESPRSYIMLFFAYLAANNLKPNYSVQ